MLRPALPRRLKHGKAGSQPAPSRAGFWGLLIVIWFWFESTRLFGIGLQFAFQKARSGAVGTWKHSVLTYAIGLPGFVRDLQPGPPNRFTNAQSSPLFVLAGSEPVTPEGVDWNPPLADKIRTSFHPPQV